MRSTRALAASTHAVSPALIAGVCVAQRRLLHLVGVHRGERLVVLFAGADADHPLDRLHEDLAVSDLPGAGGRQDRVDAGLHERLRTNHLDLYFLMEFHDEGGSTVLADDLVLAAVAADAAQRDAGDTGTKQRRLDFGQALGPHDRGDEFHRFLQASNTSFDTSRASA